MPGPLLPRLASSGCLWLLGCSGAETPRPAEPVDSAVGSGPTWCVEGEEPELVLTDVAPSSGVQDAETRNRGAAAADFDGDGRIDLFLANPGGPNRLYLNSGDGSFREQEGAPEVIWSIATSAVDYDDDGDADLWIACGGFTTTCPNGLFRNDGVVDGEVVFTDVSAESGVGVISAASFGSAWADIDLDGDLDLYESTKDLRLNWRSLDQGGPTPDGGDFGPSGQPDPPDLDEPPQDRLWLNQGDGTFADATETLGLSFEGNSHQAVWLDADEDGDPDLFVPVFEKDNRYYRNEGAEGFVLVTEEAGLTEPGQSFAALARDLDHDGHMDLLVGAFTEPNVLGYDPHAIYLGAGDGTFTEVAVTTGLHDPEHEQYSPVMGFQAGDLDCDGYDEVFFGHGHPQDDGNIENLLWSATPAPDVRIAWVDRRALIRQEPDGAAYPNRSHGTIFHDFDGDGDVDLFVGNGGVYYDQREPNRLFRNDSSCRLGFVDVELEGVSSNRGGIGARIQLTGEGGLVRWATVQGGTGFNSSMPLRQTLGTGDHAGPYDLVITWPSGTVDRVEGVERGSRVALREGEGS